ncbi:MAG: cytochrome c biogenesis protein [Alicyclobacillus sp.]|nr:cytochrome c biogenesis protein [Alicyclobacillus sp.]
MAAGRWLYDAFVALYALSLVLFFGDAVLPRRLFNRAGLVCLFSAFVLATLFLLGRLRALGTGALYTPFDALLVWAWLIVLVTLVVDAFFRIDLVVFLANAVGFAVAAFAAFRPGSVVYAVHQGDLLLLHVAFALLSYAAFAFAFVFSFMYLLQDRWLRAKRWNRWYFRLPSLERLDTYAFRCVLAGVPLLLVAMVLGVVWAELTLGRLSFADPKLLATAALWLAYSTALLLRIRSGWGGLQLVRMNIFCFTGVLVNFAVISSFSLLHRAGG